MKDRMGSHTFYSAAIFIIMMFTSVNCYAEQLLKAPLEVVSNKQSVEKSPSVEASSSVIKINKITNFEKANIPIIKKAELEDKTESNIDIVDQVTSKLSEDSVNKISTVVGGKVSASINLELKKLRAILKEINHKVEPPSFWKKIKDGFVVNFLWGLVSGDDNEGSFIASVVAILGLVLTFLKGYFLIKGRSKEGLDYLVVLYILVMAVGLGAIALSGGIAQKKPAGLNELGYQISELQKTISNASNKFHDNQLEKSFSDLKEKFDVLIAAKTLNSSGGAFTSKRIFSELKAITENSQLALRTLEKQEEKQKIHYENIDSNWHQWLNTIFLLLLLGRVFTEES